MSSTPPLVLVGMPRSGSTLLTRLLNESPDLFVVNDFYFLQRVDEQDAFEGILDGAIAKTLALDLVERIRARVERPDSPPLECALQLSSEQEASLEAFALQKAAEPNQTWDQLLSAVMEKTAKQLGKTRWGYNTPQDHVHLDRLFQAFPALEVIFLLRDPRDTARSYKYVTRNGYHDPNRYHPAAQSFLWRKAYRRYRSEVERNHNVLMVRYEDIVENTAATIEKIAAFTAVTFPPIDLSRFGNNSSFKTTATEQTGSQAPSEPTDRDKSAPEQIGSEKKAPTEKPTKKLRESEVCLCEQVAKAEMEALGYDLSGSQIKIGELPYLSFITLRFAWFYTKKSLLSKNVRKRLIGTFKPTH